MHQKPHRCLDQARSYNTNLKNYLRIRELIKMKTNLRLCSELRIQWRPESLQLEVGEILCPESCPHRTHLILTPMRKLQMPRVFENFLSELKFDPSQEDSYKWETLQMHWVWESFLAMLSPSRYKRIHTGEQLFKRLQCQSCCRQYEHLIGSQKTHPGEKPQQVWKKLLTELWLTHQRSHTGEKLYICLKYGKNIHWRALLGFALPKKTQSEERLQVSEWRVLVSDQLLWYIRELT